MPNFKYNSKWILGNTVWHELSFFDDRTLEVENDVLATNDSTSLVIADNNIDRLKSVGFWNFKSFLSARKRQLALLVIIFLSCLSPLKPNNFSYPNFVSLLIIYNIQTVIPSM